MIRTESLLVAAFAASFALAIPAQKLQVAGDDGRQLLLIDVGDLAGRPGQLPRLAEFVRTFAAESETDRPSVRDLGDRHLVVLGTAQQIAAIERLRAEWRQRKEETFAVEVRLCNVTEAFVKRELLPSTKPPERGIANRPLVTVLGAEAMTKLVAALVQERDASVLEAPRLLVRSMQMASIAIGDEKTFVRDFEVKAVDGSVIAEPVIGTVRDGQEVAVLCASLGSDELAVQMEVSSQSVAQPFREVKTVVPGATTEVTIQVPVVTGCRASQAVRIANGATAMMAAPRNDGTWLLCLTTATRERSTENSGR